MTNATLPKQVQGVFCPVIAPRLLALRFKKGILKHTELGIEKRCPRCEEYWPYDSEFFYRKGGDDLDDCCKSCYVQRRKKRESA